ncbi:OLC1v1036286C3 [Oldenlandia corymbosa var. corymbosa]|uniref:OLC1v1036286C3 n=2 Tax=Oldenlandia corymbosa var. corymbosa TaxID=529605 RepID=A0AAV1CW27_OLDCO|nr:OLC1v1036286C3 [Oldenlandia corymbosa var. corymbosa]
MFISDLIYLDLDLCSMPEARDRLLRVEDLAAIYTPRRRSAVLGQNPRSEAITILADDRMAETPTTPFRWGATPLTGSRSRLGVTDASVLWSGGSTELRTPRIMRGTALQMSPGTATRSGYISRRTISSRDSGVGQDNGRIGAILPQWYPRIPLGDITETVRTVIKSSEGKSLHQAVDRRQSRLREDEQRLGSPTAQSQIVLDSKVSTVNAQLEHEASLFTPYQKIKTKPYPVSVGKVSKLLLDITSQDIGESSFLTPQKKLLNSIDTVEKVIMEELLKFKRTPMAKKAERERKVRTLMSMR